MLIETIFFNLNGLQLMTSRLFLTDGSAGRITTTCHHDLGAMILQSDAAGLKLYCIERNIKYI
jgi:hypothetical protein